MNHQDKRLISREPWWAKPPEPGQDELSVEWGWLEHWSDGSWRFDEERPSDAQIKNRKGCRLA
ncbi:hypothetical protein [Acidihalobacter aeolianus]|uniref:hypothetical protein n=1 Tax=Acidihalobacter aeolianus TaxID=2792603 RepID=UPI0009F3F410|nr:hypothetical protein [Acidihalobacter aeolianus]